MNKNFGGNLPTIGDSTLKIFHLIYLDSGENHLKAHWKTLIFGAVRVFLALVCSFRLKIERKIAFRNATSRRNRMTEISFPFYIPF